MIAAGPSQGDRPLGGEASEARFGGIRMIAAGPSQGDRPLLLEGVRDAAPAASLGEVAS